MIRKFIFMKNAIIPYIKTTMESRKFEPPAKETPERYKAPLVKHQAPLVNSRDHIIDRQDKAAEVEEANPRIRKKRSILLRALWESALDKEENFHDTGKLILVDRTNAEPMNKRINEIKKMVKKIDPDYYK